MEEINQQNPFPEKEVLDEDDLLDPIAKSILRELEDNHVSSDHIDPSTSFVVELENGEIIKCDEDELTPNELVHCNMALEQNQNDSAGDQGGQSWREPTKSPTPEPTTSLTPEPSAPPSTSPTLKPSMSPSSSPVTTLKPSEGGPTGMPSYHPTLHGDPWTLRGTIYYDKNANGERDSNVDTVDFGKDVEYNYGLGGIHIQLMECDADTNMGVNVVENYEAGDNSYATAVSLGYDALMHPKLVGREEMGGTYNLIDIKIDRSYYIYVKAPEGFLFSGGVCNDDIPGWECAYSSAAQFAQGYNSGRQRKLARNLRGGRSEYGRFLNGANAIPASHQTTTTTYKPPSPEELELGIREGRSAKCVSVDRTGMPDSHLDLGVMRIGDVDFGTTDVELNLDLIDPDIEVRHRSLLQEKLDGIRERALKGAQEFGEPIKLDDGSLVYKLKQEDKDAIGTVTSEVLASAIHPSLIKKGVVLDSVLHNNVLYLAPPPEVEDDASNSTSTTVDGDTSDGTGSSSATDFRAGPRDVATATPDRRDPATAMKTNNGKLSVELVVRGHYNRGTAVDFDYVVQDSINRDTHTIRRQLTYYNQNCRDQTTKVVDMGFTLEDFIEIHTNRGVRKPVTNAGRLSARQQQQQQQQQNPDLVAEYMQAFSAACNQKKVLPEYFEASLGGMQLKPKTEDLSYVVKGNAGNPWAIVGGIAAVGIFLLCLGFFLFQRGLKKKKEKLQQARVTHVLAATSNDESDSINDKIRDFDKSDRTDNTKEKRAPNRIDSTYTSGMSNSLDVAAGAPMIPIVEEQQDQRKGFAGIMQREIGNMTAAINSERRRLVGGRAPTRRSPVRDATRQNDSGISDNEDHDDQEGGLSKSLKEATAGDTEDILNKPMPNSSAMIFDEASATSRNAVPNIIQVDFEESSSSSEDENSDSSSSSDESDSSSQIRRAGRKKNKKKSKERRAANKKKSSSEQRAESKKSSNKNKKSQGNPRRAGLTRRPSQDDLDIARYRRRSDEGQSELRRSKCDLDMHREQRAESKKISNKNKKSQGNPRRAGLTRRPSQDDLDIARYRRRSDEGQSELRRSKCDLDMDRKNRRRSDMV